MPINIIIADDHPLIAKGIKNALENYKDFNILGTFNNGKEVLEFIEQTTTIDIALLDINMPIMDGIECAKKILAEYPDTKVAMLSMYQEMSIIKELINIGVKGYMLKTISTDELQIAIHNIYNGKEYFNSEITKALLTGKTESQTPYIKVSKITEELTEREKEIIKLLAEGMTNKQIGDELYISPRTVDSHRTNLMKKLNINNVASLIRFAFKNGLIS